jgi:hypothetical protein
VKRNFLVIAAAIVLVGGWKQRRGVPGRYCQQLGEKAKRNIGQRQPQAMQWIKLCLAINHDNLLASIIMASSPSPHGMLGVC